MIDVQILMHGSENPEWLRECIVSLREQPVRVHFGVHKEGNFNEARRSVWDRCGGEFLCSVDPDDVVMPGAFAACLKILDRNPEAGGAFTWEEVSHEETGLTAPGITSGNIERIPLTPNAAHHIVVVRRRVYDAIRAFTFRHHGGFDWCVAVAAHHLGGLMEVPQIGYRWRVHRGSASFRHRYPRNVGQDALRWLQQIEGTA